MPAPTNRTFPLGSARIPTWRDGLVLIVLVLLTALPFLSKAIHLDDALYLRVAENILQNPLDPYAGTMHWDDPNNLARPLVEIDFNPPLWKYLLAGTIALVGRSESALHLLPMLFLFALAFGLFRLASRVVTRPAWLTGLVLTAPFFWPGQNLMLEVSMLTWMVWSIEFGCQAYERQVSWPSIFAGTLLGLAILTKYTAGLMLPVVVWVLIVTRFRPLVWMLVIPIAMLIMSVVALRMIYPQGHFGQHGFMIGGYEFVDRLLVSTRTIGAMIWFTPVLVWLMIRDRQIIGLMTAIGLASVLAYFDVRGLYQSTGGWSPTTGAVIHFALFTWQGGLLLMLVLVLLIKNLSAVTSLLLPGDGSEPRSAAPLFTVTLCLIIVGTVLFNMLSVPFIAVRHLLFAHLALLILICWRADGAGLRLLPNACAGVHVLIGLALAFADFEFAKSQRDYAAGVAKRVGLNADSLFYKSAPAATQSSGPTIWHTAQWGLGHYLNKLGARSVTRSGDGSWQALKPGDLYVDSEVHYFVRLMGFPEAELAAKHLDTERGAVRYPTIPLHTVNYHTNYYGLGRHDLPWQIIVTPTKFGNTWTVTYQPVDLLKTYRINQPYVPAKQ